MTTSASNITLATDIESAVAWRNIPSLARRIVVFIQNESRKSHSLSDFDTLTARDLASFCLESLFKPQMPEAVVSGDAA
jgi:hypothetical protein